MKPMRLDPGFFEGGSFSLRDLDVALAWADENPGVQLKIRLDHPYINEVIEICPSLSAPPRWLMWNNADNELCVADLAIAGFKLPYLTVDTALHFIKSILYLIDR